MLDEKDKEWILGAISGTILGTVPSIVDQRIAEAFETQKVWYSTELKTQLKTELDLGLNKLRVELTDVMREGFFECASAQQVSELTGYVEEVRDMVADGFAECASAKQVGELLEMVGDGFAECASATQMERVEKRTEHIEDIMVTRSHFDQRTGEDTIFHKKQSTKFTTLVEALRQEKILSTRRANVVLALEPHPIKLNE